MADTSTPMVSVILLTYNHEKYIRQALDSIASQKTSFDFELVISEDKSTDDTRAIIQDFLRGYEGEVTLLYSEENLHSAVVGTRALRAASGKYIAYLDGDDYWTSDVKLQRQFEFMEANPDCALSHHPVERVDEGGNVLRLIPSLERRATIDDLIQGNFIQSCSVMLRRSAIADVPTWLDELPIVDWPLYALAAQHGWIGWLEGTFGHYRVHSGAVWSTTSLARQWAGSLFMLNVLEEHFGEEHRSAFADSRGKITGQLLDSLAGEESRSVSEVVFRERELAVSERADKAIAEASLRAHQAVGEADQRAEQAMAAAHQAVGEADQRAEQAMAAAHQAVAEADQRAATSLSREVAALSLLVQREHQFGEERNVFRASLERTGASLAEITHLLRRERRTGRRFLVIGLALLAILTAALVWLAVKSAT